MRERYGIEPELVPDFIALRGDPSDGLPGAPGIGAKTAAELLRAHGSLEGVLAAARTCGTTAHMRPRAAAALREHAELLRTFKHDRHARSGSTSQRPPTAPTDFAGGARDGARAGHAGLAERLDAATRAATVARLATA